MPRPHPVRRTARAKKSSKVTERGKFTSHGGSCTSCCVAGGGLRPPAGLGLRDGVRGLTLEDVKRIGLVGVLLAVVLCGSAQAGLRPVQFGLGYPATAPLTATQKAAGPAVAATYWRRAPACGIPSIVWGVPGPEDGGLGEETTGAAWADYAKCRIIIRPLVGLDGRIDPRYSWPDYCVAVAHEWGHLLLGPTYFQAVNSSDAAHSPDPRDVMYQPGDPASVPPCVPRAASRTGHHRQR